MLFIYNWKITALQYFFGFCHKSARISHRYTYVPSLLNLPPLSPSQPSRLSQSTGLSSLSHTANFHWLCVLHMVLYMFPCCSLRSAHPLLPCCVHKPDILSIHLSVDTWVVSMFWLLQVMLQWTWGCRYFRIFKIRNNTGILPQGNSQDQLIKITEI